MTTRICRHCGEPLRNKRAHAEYCDSTCRADATRLRKELLGGDKKALRSAASDRSGTRDGNVRSVAEARSLQEAQKEKDRWSGLIDLQIEQTLLSTGVCHANDLDDLGVPPAHCNLIGTRMARFRNKGYMEPTTERRKVTHSAANGRRNPVYRITAKGWKELKPLAGVGAGPLEPQAATQKRGDAPGTSANPGENSRVEGRGEPGQFSTSAAVKALDSASPGSGEALSLLPEPDPEAWAA